MIPKFRAWWKSEGKMITNISWFRFKQRDLIGSVGEQTTPVVSFDDVILMQSTGLFDKNGVEIFEGDILQYKYPYDKRMKTFGIVVWRDDKACFGLNDMKGLTTEQIELYRVTAENYLEVIGNIYENPELVHQETV